MLLTFIRNYLLSECPIEAVSWGYNDNMQYSGYIAIKSKRVINTTSDAYRGFNLLELNVSSCSSIKILNVDTQASIADSEKMANYIKSLPLNTVLIGITSDDAISSLTQNATSALVTIGVVLTNLKFRGKAFFAAQIGQPFRSVSRVAPPGGGNLKITVNGDGAGIRDTSN